MSYVHKYVLIVYRYVFWIWSSLATATSQLISATLVLFQVGKSVHFHDGVIGLYHNSLIVLTLPAPSSLTGVTST